MGWVSVILFVNLDLVNLTCQLDVRYSYDGTKHDKTTKKQLACVVKNITLETLLRAYLDVGLAQQGMFPYMFHSVRLTTTSHIRKDLSRFVHEIRSCKSSLKCQH